MTSPPSNFRRVRDVMSICHARVNMLLRARLGMVKVNRQASIPVYRRPLSPPWPGSRDSFRTRLGRFPIPPSGHYGQTGV